MSYAIVSKSGTLVKYLGHPVLDVVLAEGQHISYKAILANPVGFPSQGMFKREEELVVEVLPVLGTVRYSLYVQAPDLETVNLWVDYIRRMAGMQELEEVNLPLMKKLAKIDVSDKWERIQAFFRWLWTGNPEPKA